MNTFAFHLRHLYFFSIQRSSFRFLSNVGHEKISKSYAFRTGSIQLSNATMGEILEQAAKEAGDEIAFISEHQGISKTYHEFRNEAEKLASGFVAQGFRKGDRIGIYSPNCYEWPLTQFAAAKAGLVLVHINPAAQANELEYFIQNVGCKAFISFDKFKSQDGYRILNKIVPNLSTSDPKKLKSKNLPSLEKIIMLSDESKEGTMCFNEVFESGNKESQEALSKVENSIEFDDHVNIQFTSGTTGRPKAAVLSHHNIVNNAMICCGKFGFSEKKHIVCSKAPMFHSIGCTVTLLGTIMFNNTCVIPSNIFDPVSAVRCIEKHKCTTSIGTPTMFIDLLKAHKELRTDISSLEHVIVGGAPPPESLLTDFRETLNSPCVQIGFGLTETSPCILLTDKESSYGLDVSNKLKPLNYLEIKLVDENGNTVPINEPGEVCCRGHAVFLGYLDKEQTEKAVDKARWFHSGDIATMNEKGEFKFSGRIKDMVNRGGENIYCVEVENFISSHPAVHETFTVGVPDKRLGEEICCWIIVKPGMSVTEEEIRNFCKGKISHYKIPRYIMFVEEFPKTITGKVKKFEMARISKEKLNL